MNGAPAISVIMPCYNRAHDLIHTLRAYDQQHGTPPFELIAVDDGSNDQTLSVLSAYQPRRFTLKVLHQENNQGPAAARNRGLAATSSPLILFVGDDILPDTYLVEGHLLAHRYYLEKEIAILGQVVWPADLPVNTLMAHIDGIGAQQFSYRYLQDGHPYDFRHFYTANISLKKELLQLQSKWFDTQFPYAAFEDAELSFRLTQHGMRILYASHLKGYHYHYHTIWTFSLRQFRAGMMACLLVRKHPGTRKLLLGRGWHYHLFGWNILSRLQAASRQYSGDDAERLESETLHRLSEFEWSPHPELDSFYLAILTYFYIKGAIYGTFGDTPQSRRIADVLAQRRLVPALAKMMPS